MEAGVVAPETGMDVDRIDSGDDLGKQEEENGEIECGALDDELPAKETAAENEDPMELDSADADEPAMPVEKMHKLTLAKKAAASKPET